MRTVLAFVFATVCFAFLTAPVQAQQCKASPAYCLAEFAEGSSPPDSTVSKYRTTLIGVAARYPQDRSVVADAFIEGGQRLRSQGIAVPVLRILGTSGLGRVVRDDRDFGEVWNAYLDYRIEERLSHEDAIKKLQPY